MEHETVKQTDIRTELAGKIRNQMLTLKKGSL